MALMEKIKVKSTVVELDGDEMTGDLVRIAEPSDNNRQVDSEAFLHAIKGRLEEKL